MTFEDRIQDEKENSLDTDYKLAGAKLMPNLEKRGTALVNSVADQLARTKPNNDDILVDDRLRLKQANRDVRFEATLTGIINTFNNNILGIRDSYYKYVMDRLVKVWEDSVNPLFLEFGGIELKFTKKEIATLTRNLFGSDISNIIKDLRDRTLSRFRQVVNDSYRSSRDKGRDIKSEYTKALRGAMNNLMKSFNNIIKGFTQVIWEQAYSRFLVMLNG
jgi:hypothetical protein